MHTLRVNSFSLFFFFFFFFHEDEKQSECEAAIRKKVEASGTSA